MTLTAAALCYAALCATLTAVRQCRLSTPLHPGGWVLVVPLSAVSAPLLACLPETWEGSILHLCGPVALTGLIAALFAGPPPPAPLAHRDVAPVVLCVLLHTVEVTSTVGEHIDLKGLYGNEELLGSLSMMFLLGSTLAVGKYVYRQITQQTQPSPRFWPPVLGFIAVRWVHGAAVVAFHDYILALNALHGCALWYCLWSNVEVSEWYHAPIYAPARLAWAAMRGWGKAVGWLWRFVVHPLGAICGIFTPRNPQAVQVLQLQLQVETMRVEMLQLRNAPQPPQPTQLLLPPPPRSPPSPPRSPPRARGRPRKSSGNVLSLEQAIHKAPHKEVNPHPVKPHPVKPSVVKLPQAVRALLFKPLELPPEPPALPEPAEHMVVDKTAKKRPPEAKSPVRRTRSRKYL